MTTYIIRSSLQGEAVNQFRIAYFTNQYPKVSHTFIRREILALERQGFDILRIALRGWDGELVDAEDVRERERTRYVLQDGMIGLVPSVLKMLIARPIRFFLALQLALKMGIRANRPWPFHLIYLAEACRIIPWLKEFGAHHVHAHFGTNSAEIVMLAKALGGPAYSFTVHGTDDLMDGLREKFLRSAFVVAVSSFGRGQLFLQMEYRHWGKAKVVHCGLEAEFYDVQPVPMPERHRLVCVGRLCKEKGQLLLLDAVAKLVRSGVDLELVLAGDGEMRPQVEARIAECGLEKQVRITGWLSGAQVREEILAARALVLPSFSEGLPVVIMEAMALRRPILSTYIAGIPELVRHGEDGWLFPAGALEELAAAMAECLALPITELERMGEQAHYRVVQRHDIDCEVTKLAILFREAIGINVELAAPLISSSNPVR